MTTTYLTTNLEGGGDVKTSIINGKVFEPAWTDPVGPTPVATKAMLQEEYGTRATTVAGGRNEGLNFGNVVADSEGTGNRDPGGGGVKGRKLECWHCEGEHLKRNCPKCAEEKDNKKKDDGGEWRDRGADDKRADRKLEVKGGQLHTMFTSLVEQT